MGTDRTSAGSERRQPLICGCREGKRLLESFSETVQELMLLHEQQFLAAVNADSEANRFDLLIHDANEKKQAAKYAYMCHLEEHGCLLKDEADER